MKKVIKLTESDLTRIVKRVIKEQTEEYNHNMAIQCFLNKKGVKDDGGQPLKMDGQIGTLAMKSKTAQAIAKYQQRIGSEPDGVWGEDTTSRMPNADKVIFKQCVSDHGDIFDKGAHWLGID
jgi:hypothetical protein